MMNIHNFSFVIIWIFATQIRLYRGENYAPLIVVYDEKVNFYAITDREIFDKYGPKSPGLILACSNPPKVDSKNIESSSTMSLNSFKKKYTDGVIAPVCKYPFKPSMVANKPDQNDDFSVGFHFLDDTNSEQELKKQELPSFSSAMEKIGALPRLSIYHINTDLTNASTKETRHRIISYKPFISANKKPCEEFVNTVEEVVPSEIGRLYDNQNKLWETYRKPPTLGHFVPVQLTPIDDFTDTVSRRATCTYYNTVPISSNVYENFFEKIEDKIRHVADEMAVNTIDVITKTFGVLELPFLDQEHLKGGNEKTAKVYLGGNLVPVPRMLMKIIHHWVPAKHDDLQASSEKNHYYMIIGVYNTVKAIGDDVPSVNCNYEICKKYGWDINTNPNREYQEKHIFCCDIGDLVSMQNLKLDFQGEPFDLDHKSSRYQRRSD